MARGGNQASILIGILLLLLGLSTTGCASDGNAWADDFVFDGTQFLAPDHTGRGGHWVSDDGIEWKHTDGISMALVGADHGECPDGFRCDTLPELDVADVSFHHTSASVSIEAALDDRLLIRRDVRHETFDHRRTDMGPGSLGDGVHPDVLALAAPDSACLRQVLDQQRSGNDGPARITEVQPGPQVMLRCDDGSSSDVTVVQVEPRLDDGERALLYNPRQELWVATPDGAVELVPDPPVYSWPFVDDEFPGPKSRLAMIHSSGSRLWAVSDLGLVASSNGLQWAQVGGLPIPAGAEPQWLVAGPPGAVAVVVGHDRGDHLSTVGAVFTEDDGQSWSFVDLDPGSDVVAVGGAGLVEVGATGFRLHSPSDIVDLTDDWTEGSWWGSGSVVVGVDRVMIAYFVDMPPDDEGQVDAVYRVRVVDTGGAVLSDTDFD